MQIVGCHFHPGWQQVAIFDSDTGEIEQRKLVNGDGEAERSMVVWPGWRWWAWKRAGTASGF